MQRIFGHVLVGYQGIIANNDDIEVIQYEIMKEVVSSYIELRGNIRFNEVSFPCFFAILVS